MNYLNNKQIEDFTTTPKLKDIGRYYVTEFVKQTASKLSDGSAILDAGAGECAYKKLFSHCNYKSVDLAVGDDRWNYQHLDYIAPLDNLPISDNEFDAVLATQVLEHLSKPQESVCEMFRVLKNGGVLYLTAPMAQAEHQVPFDYFRYTSHGLRHLLKVAGFSDIDIKPMGGVFVRWAYEIPAILELFPRIGYSTGNISIKGAYLTPLRLVVTIIVTITQYFFLFLDRYDKRENDTWGWKVTAIK